MRYNCLFGDPECQPILMRLQSDLLDVLEATVDGRLGEIDAPIWDMRPSICVVMASAGYPGPYSTGQEITGLEAAAEIPDVKVFYVCISMPDGKVGEGTMLAPAAVRVEADESGFASRIPAVET